MARKKIIFDDYTEKDVVKGAVKELKSHKTSQDKPGELPNDLQELCENYIVNKEQESKYKKLASSENEAIKSAMLKDSLNRCDTNLGAVTLTEKHSSKFREDELIEFLKSKGISDGIVVTKECIDYDALESAIYNKTLSDKDVKGISKFEDTTITYALNIKKKKGA